MFVYTYHLVSGLYRKVGDNLGKPQGLARSMLTQLNLRGEWTTKTKVDLVEVVLDRVVFQRGTIYIAVV